METVGVFLSFLQQYLLTFIATGAHRLLSDLVLPCFTLCLQFCCTNLGKPLNGGFHLLLLLASAAALNILQVFRVTPLTTGDEGPGDQIKHWLVTT